MPSMLSYPRRLPSGHFTCYLNRTYHVLTTKLSKVLDKFFGERYSSRHCRSYFPFARQQAVANPTDPTIRTGSSGRRGVCYPATCNVLSRTTLISVSPLIE